jgi:TatD DNase family protein
MTPEMILVDHHCHIDRPEFSADLDGVVARAHAAGVGLMVNISTRVSRFDHLISVVERFGPVYGTVGTHPHYAHEELDVTAADLARLAAHPKIIGLGEAGLDYYYKHSTPEAQAQGFRTHIAAARITGLPLEIHTRDADADTIRILEEEFARGPFAAVLHCFTGGRELAMRAVQLGLYVSFSGVVSFKKSDALRAIANEVPLDRILVETDAPYLAPEPFRGKQNEPAYVVHTARALAEARDMPFDAFARATTENFFRLYTKAPRPGASA